MNEKSKRREALRKTVNLSAVSKMFDSPEPAAKPQAGPRKAETSPAKEPTARRDREPGKRARGYLQINALIPAELRRAAQLALNFDPEQRDLSQLITDLMQEWIDQQPEAVRQAIKAMSHPSKPTK